MITLKHLAREFSLDNLFQLRIRLRKQFGKRRRWRWEKDDPQLEQVRTFLSTLTKP